MKLAFEEHGSGKPFVLLHAFPLNRGMWQPQIEALTARNFRTITPDLRGFGESHSFADINSMEDMAKDIGELFETLKIEKALIGGLSMGGYVLFEFFKLFPEKCAALIFCDTTFSADSDEKKEQRMDLIEKIEKNGNDVLIEEMLPNLISDFTKENKKDLVREIEKMFSETNPIAAIAALRGMAERKDHKKLLAEINVLTLLIFGEFEALIKPDDITEMNENIKGSLLVKIKNAGHYSNLEQPGQFNSALIDFAAEVNFK